MVARSIARKHRKHNSYARDSHRDDRNTVRGMLRVYYELVMVFNKRSN